MTLYLTRGLQCVATEEVCVFINMTQDYYSKFCLLNVPGYAQYCFRYR